MKNTIEKIINILKKIGKNPNYSHVDWNEKEYFEECVVAVEPAVIVSQDGTTYSD